jgi:CheY-like chemotaxis protein
MPRRRVLVIDDDQAHLDLVREVLSPYDLALDFADSGEAGLAAFARQPPDLVVLDVAMPGIDGWEAARAIRARHGDAVPILMVSANVHDFQRTRRPDDPHDDFLLKPYEVDALIDQVFLLLDIESAAETESP